VVSVIAVRLSFVYATDAQLAQLNVTEATAMRILILLLLTWTTTFATFLCLMKREYRKTFASTQLGKEATMAQFEVDDDEVRSRVVICNRAQWTTIEAEVRDWVTTNWWVFREENPAWFNENWRRRVPVDWVPTADRKNQEALLDAMVRRRQRKSNAKRLLDSFRAGTMRKRESREEREGEGGGGEGGEEGEGERRTSAASEGSEGQTQAYSLYTTNKVLPVVGQEKEEGGTRGPKKTS
jgi:hypothetical protein